MKVVDLAFVIDTYQEVEVEPYINDEDEPWYKGKFDDIPLGIATFEISEVYAKADIIYIKLHD